MKNKFKVGDRVKVSKNYEQQYNKCGIGTVVEIKTNDDRAVYIVQFDNKMFKSSFYSYQLEKVEETKNFHNRKFKFGDKVTPKKGYYKGQTAKVVDMSLNLSNRLAYRVRFEKDAMTGMYYSYELDPVCPKTESKKKDKPIVMAEFREEDTIPHYKYEIGDKVLLTDEAIEWLKKHDHNHIINPCCYNCVFEVSKRLIRNDKETPVYQLDNYISLEFYDEDLKPVPQHKYKVGQRVWLTPKTVEKLKKDDISVKEMYNPFEITSWNYHCSKILYKLDRVDGLYFYEYELTTTRPEFNLTTEEQKKEISNYLRKCRVEDLQLDWYKVCTNYTQEFCKRHGYKYDPDAWIGGEVGTIIEIADMFVSMDDIRYDVDNNIPSPDFETWYWKSVELYELGVEHYMNYPSYCKGAPDEWTEERIEKLRQSHKRLEEAKEDLEKTIEEYNSNKMLF